MATRKMATSVNASVIMPGTLIEQRAAIKLAPAANRHQSDAGAAGRADSGS